MRIVSGQYKGFQFSPPKNIKARPTTDRAKEALFNSLANTYEFENLSILDLFSGTGNIAYEFASRGVHDITCVDITYASVKYIGKTFKDLGYKNFQVKKASVLPYLQKVQDQFDIIFADPPYALDRIPEIAEIVFQRDLLKDGGLLIIEHFKTLTISHPALSEKREYGQSVFSFFRK